MKKTFMVFALSLFMILSIGTHKVSATSLDSPRIIDYSALLPSDQELKELADKGIYYKDDNVDVEKVNFTSGELTIVQTRIRKHLKTTITPFESVESFSILLLTEMYKQNTFALGCMEGYIAYDEITVENVPHYKTTKFGHRLISYESLFGAPVSLSSVVIQNGLGTLDFVDYDLIHESSTAFFTTTGIFTCQNRNIYFQYWMDGNVLSGIGLDTTIRWRNTNGTYSNFLVHTNFVMHLI